MKKNKKKEGDFQQQTPWKENPHIFLEEKNVDQFLKIGLSTWSSNKKKLLSIHLLSKLSGQCEVCHWIQIINFNINVSNQMLKPIKAKAFQDV